MMHHILNFILFTITFFLVVLAGPTSTGLRVPLIVSSDLHLVKRHDMQAMHALHAHFTGIKSENFCENSPIPLEARAGRGVTQLMPATSTYYGLVSVGTPPKRFKAVFDTGSPMAWFNSPSSKPAGRLDDGDNANRYSEGHQTYVPSSRAIQIAPEHNLYYVLGSVSGPVVKDTVTVGGVKASGVAVLAASKLSPEYRREKFGADGAIGLAFPALSTLAVPHKSLWQVLIEKRIIAAQLFGVMFGDSSDTSEISFGAVNRDAVEGDFTYMEVKQPLAQWIVPLDKVVVDQDTVIVESTHVHIDTGTTLIYGPVQQVDEVYLPVRDKMRVSDGNGGAVYAILCEDKTPVSFILGGNTYTLPNGLSFQPLQDTGYCYGAIAGDGNAVTWTLGQAFMKHWYSVFEQRTADSARIGLAKLKPGYHAKEPSAPRKGSDFSCGLSCHIA